MTRAGRRRRRGVLKNPELVSIGWSEMVDLPEWGVRRLRAKVDTGARTSALHVEDIEPLPRDRVGFDVVLHRRVRDRRIHVTAPVVRRSRVRSSTGEYQLRYFVETQVRLGPVTRTVEISLVDRGDMIFRMLLGRSALANAFVIDPAHKRIATPIKAAKARPRSKKRARDARVPHR